MFKFTFPLRFFCFCIFHVIMLFFHFLISLVFCVFWGENPQIFLLLYFLCHVIFFISFKVWFSVFLVKKNPQIFLLLYYLCHVILFLSLQVWFSVTFFSDSSASVFSMLCYFSHFLIGLVFCVFCEIFSQIFLLLYFPCYVIFFISLCL